MAPKKAAPTHPTYEKIIVSAISDLKERTGSSLPALKKKGAQQQPSLPTGWERVLVQQLRRLADKGKLTKVQPADCSSTLTRLQASQVACRTAARRLALSPENSQQPSSKPSLAVLLPRVAWDSTAQARRTHWQLAGRLGFLRFKRWMSSFCCGLQSTPYQQYRLPQGL